MSPDVVYYITVIFAIAIGIAVTGYQYYTLYYEGKEE